ncbi:unnamed protein product [Victoria cruziana]
MDSRAGAGLVLPPGVVGGSAIGGKPNGGADLRFGGGGDEPEGNVDGSGDFTGPDDGVTLEPYVGMEFDSEEACKDFYNAYARRTGFSVRIGSTSRSARDRAIIGRYFYCSKEGFRQTKNKGDGQENKKRRVRLVTREGCPAKLVVRKDGSGKWIVRIFVKDHNHPMVLPNKVQYLRSHRSSSTTAQNLIDSCMEAGVDINLMMAYLKKEASRITKLGIVERDCGNSASDTRPKVVESEDAQAVLDYFKQMQAKNPGFFYAIQVNEEECITNFFWVDGRSRTAYKYFGDAVTFTMTHRANKYKMPCALFTGLNHHRQTVFFGSALILDESESSFVWLFSTWLEAMSGRQPFSLITNQEHAIGAAVARVFPDTRHFYSAGHILKKADEKLSQLCQAHKNFREDLHKVIQMSETVEEFEESWKTLCETYDFKENQWIHSQYKIRHKWVPAYLRNTFSGDVSTTERNDSINSIFDGSGNVSTSLHDFIMQYDRSLESRCEKEMHADFETNSMPATVRTAWPLEKDAVEVYTKTVFRKFQEELLGSLAYIAEVKETDGTSTTYSVTKFGQKTRAHIVKLDVANLRATCTCQLFEYSGLQCRHVLIAFRMKNILRLPSHYVLKRFTKNAKFGIVVDGSTSRLLDSEESHTWRFNDICNLGIKFAEDGSASADLYRVALHGLDRAFEDVTRVKIAQLSH